MKKSIIGISGSMLAMGPGQFATYDRAYVNNDYILSVIRAGGIPFIIPCTTVDDVIDAQLDQIDALILSGGQDVDPIHYGEEPLKALGAIFPDRDYFDMKLIEGALERKLPIMGICRGYQVMNVYFGGTLYQDLSYQENAVIKHDQVDQPSLPTHTAILEKNQFLYKIFEEEKIRVNSFHHQTVKKLGEGLEVAAVAPDGVLEAYACPSKKIYAMQFHPEMLLEKYEGFAKIFEFFVKQI